MKRLLWIGDLHYGSIVSPTAGRRKDANEVQRYLDERWKQERRRARRAAKKAAAEEAGEAPPN